MRVAQVAYIKVPAIQTLQRIRQLKILVRLTHTLPLRIQLCVSVMLGINQIQQMTVVFLLP